MELTEEFVKDKTRPELLLVLACLLSMGAYAPSLGGPYLIDDVLLIENNPAVHGFDEAHRWFSEFFPRTEQDVAAGRYNVQYFRPLVLLSYALNWAMGGGEPFVFHVTNLLLHGLATAFVFVTLRRWLGRSSLGAFVGALLYGLHPAQTETVGWISGRPDSLLMISFCLALWGAHQWASRKRRGWGLVLLLGGTAAAFASKESAVLLGACIGAQGMCGGSESTTYRKAHHVLAGLAVLAALAYLGVRASLYPLHPFDLPQPTLSERPGLVFRSLGHYARLLFLPIDLTMYSVPVKPVAGGLTPALILGVVALVGTLSATVFLWKAKPKCAVAIVLFGALLSPALQIVPMGTDLLVALRFLSVPLLAVGLLVGQAARVLWLRRKVTSHVIRGGRPLLAVSLFACALLSFGRSMAWGDAEIFFGRELKYNGASASVLFRAARHEAKSGRKLEAWRRHACAYQLSLNGPDPSVAPVFLLTAAHLGEAVALDGASPELRDLANFLGNVVSGKPARMEMARQELRFDASQRQLQLLAPQHQELVLAHVRTLSRLGDPMVNEALAQALRSCGDCRSTVSLAVHIWATSGRTKEAESLLGSHLAASLDGPRRAELEELFRQVRGIEEESAAGWPTSAVARLKMQMLASRHREVVRLVEKRPELLQHLEPYFVESVARSALFMGRPRLALALLTQESSASEAKKIFKELMRQWGRGPTPKEPFEEGQCVTSTELMGVYGPP